MKCVIYSRVSTEVQDNERQINELKEYASDNNLEVIKIFQEKISGATKATERIEFSKMKAFISEHDIKLVLVWELSRVGRNMVDVVTTVDDFYKKQINIYDYLHKLNTLDEDGEKNLLTNVVTSILSSFAEEERKSTKRRTISGIRANVLNGGSGTGGVMPYGFKKVGKKLLVDEEEAEIVELMFTKYLSGLGTKQIANYLNRKSIPTRYNKFYGNKEVKTKFGLVKKGTDFTWRDGTVYCIITNTIYKGKRVHKGEVFEIDPIIEPKTFDKVQEMLKSNFNKQDSKRKYANILKEKILCPKCGRTYFMHKRKDNKDNAYKCLSKRYDMWCGNPSVNIDKLNNAIYPYLSKDVMFGVIEDTSSETKALEQKIGNKDIEIKNHIKELDSVENQISNILDFQLNLKKDDFLRKYHQFNKNRDQLSEKLILLEKEKEDLLSLKSKINLVKDIDMRDANLFKKYAKDYVDYIKIHDIPEMGYLSKEFTVKRDKAVMVELKPLLTEITSYFIISRRSDKILMVDLEEGEDFNVSIQNGSLSYMMVVNSDFIEI